MDRTPPAPPDRALLNVREVAEWLRLKERKVYDLVARGDLPHTRAGGKILFAPAEVDAGSRRARRGAAARSAARPRSRAATIRCSNGRCASRAAAWRCSRRAAATASSGWSRARPARRCCTCPTRTSPISTGTRPTSACAGATWRCVEWARREQGLLVRARQSRRGCAQSRHLARRGVRVAAAPAAARAAASCSSGCSSASA